MKGKKVIVHLLDGTDYGPRIVEIGNWSGKAVFCPKNQIHRNIIRGEWDNPGVYCLRFEDPITKTEKIYWGESENIRARAKSHLSRLPMNSFSEMVFFIGDSWVTKTQIKYLEYRLIEMTKEIGANMVNTNIPKMPRMHEVDISIMEDFLEQIILILPLMGFRFMIKPNLPIVSITEQGFFEIDEAALEENDEDIDDELEDFTDVTLAEKYIPETRAQAPKTASQSPKNAAELLGGEKISSTHTQQKRGPYSGPAKQTQGQTQIDPVKPVMGAYRIVERNLNATMDIVDGRIVVRKGSFARKTVTPSLGDSYKRLKAKLAADGILADAGDLYVFTQDYSFPSPSAASNIVIGRQTAGPRQWVDSEGKSLRGIVNDSTG